MSRVFLTVLDSFGIGASPDAHEFSDIGANTLGSIRNCENFCADNLKKLGLFNIDGVDGGIDFPIAKYGRMQEKSRGKDTTTGHWEIAGLISENPMPTYPDGFDQNTIDSFCARTGRGVLCNKPYSGTDVIRDYGDEHLKTGALIVYTSADSVFQIAAHTDIVPLDTLYEYCKIAREITDVGRVIARPFTTENGVFKRTADRRDFSLKPRGETMLDRLKARGLDVISVGKIYDIFAGCGITEYHLTHSNREGMDKMYELADKDFDGLCFTNLVDFDSSFGHRNDAEGYAGAIAEFDGFITKFIDKMKEDDTLIITADHGCDPGDVSTDHTREYVPLIIYKKGIAPKNLGTLDGFDNVSKIVEEML